MAKKMSLERLPSELADRARAVFSGVVNDLDKLLSAMGSKLGSGALPPKRELLRIVAALRKSLDARLSALERVIAGGKATKKRAVAKKAAKKAATKATKATKKTVKKAVKKAARPAKSAAKAGKAAAARRKR